VAASKVGDEDARKQIEADLRRANDAFNQLFGHELKPIGLELLPPRESNAYSDLTTFHAPPAVAQLPEMTWHSASFAHLNQIVPVFTGANAGSALIYAYSDVLPVAIRQLGLVESPNPQSWDVYAGAVAWLEAAIQGRDFKLGDDNRPLRSLKNPGSAYNDQILGKDPQIAHYKDFRPDLEVHAAAGIGGKAFYEAASRIGVKRAIEIWIAGLKQAAKAKSLTYPRWASALVEVSGADRASIVEALQVVGLDVADDTASAPTTRRRKTS
jgi:thermolysin metallopeptidase-like protein